MRGPVYVRLSTDHWSFAFDEKRVPRTEFESNTSPRQPRRSESSRSASCKLVSLKRASTVASYSNCCSSLTRDHALLYQSALSGNSGRRYLIRQANGIMWRSLDRDLRTRFRHGTDQ